MKKTLLPGITGLLLGMVLFTIIFKKPAEEQSVALNEPVEEEILQEMQYLYGFAVDSFEIEHDRVKRNQNLSTILNAFGVDAYTIDKVARSSKDVFDVRYIRAGQDYTFLKPKDTARKDRFFVYEKDPVSYVVFEIKDQPKIYAQEKEVRTEIRSASGIIKSSLYETLDAAELDPAVAIKLADIYAWAIDFYRIQKNDKFKLIYEQKYVEDKPIGVGRIKAAVFSHFDKEYYAFYYEDEEGKGGYYDDDAKSLKKAFLKAPLKFTRISSRYTMKRFHPVQKRWKAHLGTDYAAPTGTPVVAAGEGTVVEARYTSANGNYVKIRHNSTYTTQYLHLSKIESGIRPGKRVSQGQQIGRVGSTGLATGPHLCYRFWKNGKQVDALAQVFPPAKPIEGDELQAFSKVRDNLKKELDGMDYENQVRLLSEL